MGFFYWFRVGIMCVTLVGIVMIMRELNQPRMAGQQNKIAKFFNKFTGGDEFGINLCPTRVTKIETTKVSVFQEGMQWFRTTPSLKEMLDPVAVEKWFSRNCSIPIKKTNASADVHTAAKLHFVAGEPLTLLKSASGEFEWMGQPFQSPQMDKALEELTDLPVSTKK